MTLSSGSQKSPKAEDSPAPDFKVGIELPCQVPVSKAVEAALRDLGIGYVNYYLRTFVAAADHPASETGPAMLDLCARLGLDYSIATFEVDPPDEAVREAVKASAPHARAGRFRGVVFDELDLCRLLGLGRPFPLADYKAFTSLSQAYEETVKGLEKLRAKFGALGSPVVATHVFPVLLHAAARAGFTVCPKIQKELYSSISLAIGMGAAKQYGRDLWVDCDLWYFNLVPGHPPEEMRCNLLLAYWLGVDLVYLEGAGLNLRPAGNQGIPFSLMTQITPDTYQLTPHGEVLRWFTREYIPKHPRPWTFREVRPYAAIVRFDDTDYGQRYVPESFGFARGLYGTERLKSDADTSAWFQIWNLLTFSMTGRDGITFNKRYGLLSGYEYARSTEVIPSYATLLAPASFHGFFVPLNGVVVYDHLVGYEHLKDIPLLFLTGKEVSPATMETLRRCVREGAMCVAWGPLAKRNGFADWQGGTHVIGEGKGKWILTDDFQLPEVVREIWPYLGRSDTIRYRFGAHEVVIRRVTDNKVEVEVDGVVQR